MSDSTLRTGLRRGVWVPATMAGALVMFWIGSIEGGPIRGLFAAVIGGLFGLAVGALIRAFPVAPFAYPAAGLIAAPAVLAVLGPRVAEDKVMPVAMIFGLVVGVLEWGAASARAREGASSSEV